MLGQYLVLLGATNWRKSKWRSDKTVNYPQANKENILCPSASGKFMHRLPKVYIFRQCFILSLVLELYFISVKIKSRIIINLSYEKEEHSFILTFL